MSTMSMLDLQCQEAQEMFTLFLDSSDQAVTMPAAVEMLQSLTFHLTPIGCWELTLPYMLQWAWEEFAIPPTTLH